MGLPAIFYNGRTINFPLDIYTYQADYPGAAAANVGSTNVVETLNVAPDVFISVAARLFENANSTHAAFKRNLYQWLEWARMGYAWQFAVDSSLTYKSTLSAGASAGASSVVVTSATGLSVGDNVIIKSLLAQELGNVASIAGTTIGLTEPLLFTYASGVRIRHEKYWPARLADYSSAMSTTSTTGFISIKKHPVQEKPPLHFDIELMFMEDMN